MKLYSTSSSASSMPATVDKAYQQGALADLITESALKQLRSTRTLLLLEIRCQISSIAEGHHNAEVVLLRIDE